MNYLMDDKNFKNYLLEISILKSCEYMRVLINFFHGFWIFFWYKKYEISYIFENQLSENSNMNQILV